MEQTTTLEAAQTAVTARSILKSIKENRIEVLLVIMLGHLLGLSDRLVANLSGMCL